MPEPISQWWRRRQFSRGAPVPYAVGSYRAAWLPYPVLVHQYHPEFNEGIVLSQIPPAADVYLCWQCDAGHVFVATPEEQRSRPGRERRRSAWCPECADLARPRTPRPREVEAAAGPSIVASEPVPPATVRPRRSLCSKTPELPVGTPFSSVCSPPPASAVEARLREALSSKLEFEPGLTAVRVGRPFFEHVEVWPDIVLGELRVAIEYDSIGRHGLEHVGRREAADRRKDRVLRAAGWEVVRIRTGRLLPLGPHDLVASGVSAVLVDRLLDELRTIRGPLLVDAYLRD